MEEARKFADGAVTPDNWRVAVALMSDLCSPDCPRREMALTAKDLSRARLPGLPPR